MQKWVVSTKCIALVSIRKAIGLEPNIEKVPQYLELQGHIESSIGELELAVHSFQRAIKIITDNPGVFNKRESKELERRLNEAVEEKKDEHNKRFHTRSGFAAPAEE